MTQNTTKMEEMVHAHIGNGKLSTVKRSSCRLIKKEYYKKGNVKVENSGGCYLVNDKWYRDTTGYIVYEYSTQSYVLKSSNDVIKGIVDIIDDNGKETIKEGYILSSANTDVIRVRHVNKPEIISLTDKVYNSQIFVEDISSGDVWFRDGLSRDDIHSLTSIKQPNRSYKNSLSYTIDDRIDRAIKTYKDGLKKQVIPQGIASHFRNTGLSEYTFGVEFETTAGRLSDRLNSELGLVPVRDGSVAGLEYATVPYQGVAGFNTITKVCDELTKRTRTDSNCSLHVHVGGIPRTMEYLTALFKVLCLVEKEMYGMFPSYKENNRGYKNKNYTKPLPKLPIFQKLDRIINSNNIKENFSYIFEYLSGGQNFSNNYRSLDDVKGHPSDPNGTRKWSISGRYHWVNLIPIIFGNKKTVEFRVHTSTMDKNKVRPYIMLCMGILDYVKHNQEVILSSRIGSLALDNLISNTTLSNNEKDDVYNYVYERTRFINRSFGSGVINPNEENFKMRSHVMDSKPKSTSKREKFILDDPHTVNGGDMLRFGDEIIINSPRRAGNISMREARAETILNSLRDENPISEIQLED